jgi:hypothetical protein
MPSGNGAKKKQQQERHAKEKEQKDKGSQLGDRAAAFKAVCPNCKLQCTSVKIAMDHFTGMSVHTFCRGRDAKDNTVCDSCYFCLHRLDNNLRVLATVVALTFPRMHITLTTHLRVWMCLCANSEASQTSHATRECIRTMILFFLFLHIHVLFYLRVTRPL